MGENVKIVLLPSGDYVHIEEYFDEVKPIFFNLFQDELIKHRSLKINLELFGQFVLQLKETVQTKSFNTRNKVIHFALLSFALSS